MKQFLVKMPMIAVEAHSEAEAYGLVMHWLSTTLSALPICNAVTIEPAEVTRMHDNIDVSNVIDMQNYKK